MADFPRCWRKAAFFAMSSPFGQTFLPLPVSKVARLYAFV
jgi:hypothetical protein